MRHFTIELTRGESHKCTFSSVDSMLAEVFIAAGTADDMYEGKTIRST